MYQVTLIVQGQDDYTFTATDEDFELNSQDILVDTCEKANIDTNDVVNVISEHITDEGTYDCYPFLTDYRNQGVRS